MKPTATKALHAVAVLLALLSAACANATPPDGSDATSAPPTPAPGSAGANTTERAPDEPDLRRTVPTEPSTSPPSANGPNDDAPGTAQRFPQRVSADGTRLLTGDGRSWIAVGDAGWSSMAVLDPTEQRQYLARLAELGYNSVLVNVIENAFSNHPPEDAAGNSPFDDDMFASPPDPSFWSGVDRYVDDARAFGITVLMVPAYIGFADDNGIARELAAVSVDDAFGFGAFLGERYLDRPNVMWVMGGDRTEVSPDLLERIDGIARGIRSVDRVHLMTGHSADGALGSDVYGAYGWLDVDTVYDIAGELVAEVRRSLAATPPRPVISIEGLYENERDVPLAPGDPYLRYQSWGALMAGAVGHVFGNNPRWHFDTRGIFPAPGTWQLSLFDPDGVLDRGTVEMGHLATFVAREDLAMAPPDVSGRLVTRSDGELPAEGRLGRDVAYVYLPDGTTAHIDISALGTGVVAITRFDPTTGRFEADEPPTEDGGDLVLSPVRNGQGATDWVVILRTA